MFIEEPINIHANLLSHEMTFITIPKNNLKNINQVFIDCDIEISRLISRTFSSGVKLLSYKELEEAMTNPKSIHRSKYLKKRKLNLHKMEAIPVCKIPK